MLESKFALNNLNFKYYFEFFFVRARIGPKKWGGQIDPPLVNRVLANTLVKEGLISFRRRQMDINLLFEVTDGIGVFAFLKKINH